MNIQSLDLKASVRSASKMAGLLAGVAVVALAIAGSASAQTVESRTSDYTLSYSSPTFANAGVFGSSSVAYPAQAAFTNAGFELAFAGNATNLAFQQGGGITVSPQGPLNVSPVPLSISGDGTAGYWGWSYNADGPGGPFLTVGSQGGLSTLTFTGGGVLSGFQGIDYYVNVLLPGDWTTAGTATGDYRFNGVGAGFSTPTFTYDPSTQVTTVSTLTTDYTSGENVGLSLTLFGAPVPEPAAWAMLILGVAMTGLALRRRREGVALAG